MLAHRHFWSLVLLALLLILFRSPLVGLISLSLQDDRYSHLAVIPFASLSLIIFERKRIFCEPRACTRIGLPLMVTAVVDYFVAEVRWFSLAPNDRLSLAVLGMALSWMAVFILCYGLQSFRTAIFPLLFLLLMVPLPPAVLDKIVFGLQAVSAQLTYILFRLVGIPVLWQGFKFSLPGVDIEIAKECSGIRSTEALFIMGLLASHMFLHSGWRKLLLSVAAIPIAIVKNAVRIVSISALGIYVDRSFFYGRLHHRGGIVFVLLALGIFLPLLFRLQKSERRTQIGKNETISRGHGRKAQVPSHADVAAR